MLVGAGALCIAAAGAGSAATRIGACGSGDASGGVQVKPTPTLDPCALDALQVAVISLLSAAPFTRLLAEVPRLARPSAGALQRPLLVPLLSLAPRLGLL